MYRKLITTALAALAICSCTPTTDNPTTTTLPDGRLYIDQQSDITPIVTPKVVTDGSNVWGYAPNIDDHYGGTLYAGTQLQTQDPRPALVDGNQPLRMWVAKPDNSLTDRPAILWFHGGGFALGVDSMHGLAQSVGASYAKRGYVSISVEYRIDTTLHGTGQRPPALCQWVQDNTALDGTPEYEAAQAQCERNITAATRDAIAAVRYVRAHASDFGIDPNKVVVGGFSAGAVTASNTAYMWDDVGDVSYFTGDPLSASHSRPNAVIGASGCTPSLDGQLPPSIDSNDVPWSMIASRYDQAVDYGCTARTVTAALNSGLVAELTSYCSENLHAANLYEAHLSATDNQWTTFMTRELGIYPDMPAYEEPTLCAGTGQ